MTMMERPQGLSVWEGELYATITDHIANEGELLAEYDDLAARSSGHVRFLVELIGDDEARHHKLFEQWANALRAFPYGAAGADALPPVGPEDDPERVASAADRLLAIEHDDDRELKRLRRELGDVEDTTLWALMVDLMRLDTAKHIRILEFLRRHARETAKAG
jgi:hypothetical protein